MSDPNASTVELVAALAVGAASAALASLGLSYVDLTWAVVGSIVGVSFAPPTSRVRAILLFAASVLMSAKLGVTTIEFWLPAHPDFEGAASAAIGVCFHPLMAALVARVPSIVSKGVT